MFDASGRQLASGTPSASCDWLTVSVVSGQPYSVRTGATQLADTGLYRSAWSVGATTVAWAVGTKNLAGVATTFSFPVNGPGAIGVSTCGPAGVVFSAYLESANQTVLASGTAPSNCQSFTYTVPGAGLYKLVELSQIGGGWSGQISAP